VTYSHGDGYNADLQTTEYCSKKGGPNPMIMLRASLTKHRVDLIDL